MTDRSILTDRYLLAGNYRLTERVGMRVKVKLLDSYWQATIG
jgi:hypothetical protein